MASNYDNTNTTWWNRMTSATGAAYQTFRLVYANPATEQRQAAFHSHLAQYDLLWAYYNNSLFDVTDRSWQSFRQSQSLYRNTRSIYNPVKRLVDFYAGAIYPGVLSADGADLPDGERLAIPFPQDTDPELIAAIGVLWDWSAWQTAKTILPRWGAALGSVLIEVEDDPSAGQVFLQKRWPGHVIDLRLDNQGRVKSYIIEFFTEEPLPGMPAALAAPGVAAPYRQYRYRKEVNEETIRFFKDGQPFDYDTNTPGGPGAVALNIYGFAPAVWIKHSDVGGIHGQCAAAGILGKINQLNSKTSQLHDYIGKAIAAPALITSGSPIAGLMTDPNAPAYTKEGKRVKRGPTDEYGSGGGGNGDRESMAMISAPLGTEVKSLVGTLDIASTLSVLDRLYSEIEADNPEITFWSSLRQMSQVTGPAVEMLSGDVLGRVREAASLYDHGSVELFKMAVAIAGHRANSGEWGSLTDQQKAFLPFDLDSYTARQLELSILPRPLVPISKSEQAQERIQYFQGVQAATNAGVPLEMTLQKDGWSATDLAQIQAHKDAQQQQALEVAQASRPAPSPVASGSGGSNTSSGEQLAPTQAEAAKKKTQPGNSDN